MRNTMLSWIEDADARSACERPAVVLLTREARFPVLQAAPVAVLIATLLLAFGC